jgi:phage protein U
MLFQLGSLTIDSPGGLNAQEIEEDFGADFAVKPIVGAMAPREATGIADHLYTISGTIYPFAQARAGVDPGMAGLAVLKSMVYSQESQILVDGTGQNLGWYKILHVKRKDGVLTYQGIGRTISYQINLAEDPNGGSPAAMLATLLSLFQ